MIMAAVQRGHPRIDYFLRVDTQSTKKESSERLGRDDVDPFEASMFMRHGEPRAPQNDF